MNPLIEQWLEEQKKEQEQSQETLKKEHLKNLKLVDPKTKKPLEVTDEEYAEILKYSSNKASIDDEAEKALISISKIFYALAILLAIASIVTSFVLSESMLDPFVSLLIGIAVGLLLYLIFICPWAVLRTLANISLRLKKETEK